MRISDWSSDVCSSDLIAHLTSDYAGKPIPDHFDSIEQAVQEARKAQPELKPAFVSYPGTGYSGDHHYGVFMKGNSSLSERNFQPVLVDAVTAKLTAVPRWPLALSVMYLSQPLHFGDYAGLPLKIIWGIFDLIAIILLVSGLYLWLGRRGTSLRLRVREVSRSEEHQSESSH